MWGAVGGKGQDTDAALWDNFEHPVCLVVLVAHEVTHPN